MCDILLGRLKDDHRRLEHLFLELERQCAAKEGGRPIDLLVLRAIVDYLGDGALLFHHALEDAIYMELVHTLPRFREIYDLAEDHRASWREFERLKTAVSGPGEELVEAIRSFIGNERGHFISEEEIFFPYARAFVRNEDWLRLERSAPAAELLSVDVRDSIVARLFREGLAFR
jgi:hemerythrin-like domain-containing protein